MSCLGVHTLFLGGGCPRLSCLSWEKSNRCFLPKRASSLRALSMPSIAQAPAIEPSVFSFPILINGCTGKMGRAVANAAVSAGIQLIPVTFSSMEKPNRTLKVGNVEIQILGPSEKENVLSSVYNEFQMLLWLTTQFQMQ
ncbi:hypothetical protein HPP92_022332 [Vanilla planifolia]|uniref:Uncharacterized protein n=1 Tax=Vanilla planifolia TaxID=51239 RepID=A0A835UDP9_VANPL|nr:hypothetical protein HPP92_022332 [Vanilla planifolia]